MTDWTIVVPFKGTAAAKSRVSEPGRAELAIAMALDTVEAALVVAPVVVVTSEAAAAGFEQLGATVVIDSAHGLNAAISLGIAGVHVPALGSAELAAALAGAAGHPLAMVADADGVGTVLLTSLDPAAISPAFGPGSRSAHVALGHIELEVPAGSGLRRDVDTREQLLALPAVGRRTAELR
jgi:2-phospho-L-lactate guanylyltransferase